MYKCIFTVWHHHTFRRPVSRRRIAPAVSHSGPPVCISFTFHEQRHAIRRSQFPGQRSLCVGQLICRLNYVQRTRHWTYLKMNWKRSSSELSTKCAFAAMANLRGINPLIIIIISYHTNTQTSSSHGWRRSLVVRTSVFSRRIFPHLCPIVNRQPTRPTRVGKWVVSHAITWKTKMETIIQQTVVAASQHGRRVRVRVCGHGPRLRLNAGPCLWRTAPLQLLQGCDCGATIMRSLYLYHYLHLYRRQNKRTKVTMLTSFVKCLKCFSIFTLNFM